jgi:ABC-type transport system involved in cytochrome bd biosynthesis fused ATPase/permease subunit
VGAQAGLSNLIRDRTGADIPLEVWDEPTQGLSEEGVLDLLDCLAARAKREDRQIWVVDHRSLGYGGFDGTATVVKTEAGSHIVQPRV